MQLKRLLASCNAIKSICRSYVSVVNVNVNSFSSIKVKLQDYLEASNDEVQFKLLDSQQREVTADKVNSLNVDSNRKEFNLNCCEANDLSMVLELPIESSPEVLLNVTAQKSDVHVTDIQTKGVAITVESGHISLKNVKSDSIDVETGDGNVTTKSLLLGKVIKLVSKNGNVSVEKSQGDSLEVDGAAIRVDSCYSTHNKFMATDNAVLKNLHANTTIYSTGQSLKLSGFSGTLYAQLHSEEIELQLSELFGKNQISSTNPEAKIKLGLAEGIINDTNFKLSSNCKIVNTIPEMIICHKTKVSFEVAKENPAIESHLEVNVMNGESVELSKMSWIDALKLRQ